MKIIADYYAGDISRWVPLRAEDGQEFPTIRGESAYNYANETLPYYDAKTIHIYNFDGMHRTYKRESEGCALEITLQNIEKGI